MPTSSCYLLISKIIDTIDREIIALSIFLVKDLMHTSCEQRNPAMDLNIITKGIEELISEKELLERLKKGKPLKIKWGADPSAPDLHLGHTVVIRKLKQFQDMGHEIIFLIGDFTARIGDPTGKSETRKPLSAEQVDKNAKTYQEQVFKILDRHKTKVVYNSHWLNKMTASDLVHLTGKQTVARMLERDDFEKRYKSGQAISIHEFLYPLFQGYDSVELKSDIEIGGTDQKFNLLMGRQLQADWGQEPQVVITMPILEGLDGVQKMSKSLGNHVGITEPANEMFGKLMSIPDALMPRYYQLLTDLTFDAGRHPKESKVILAKNIVSFYHGEKAADEAAANFENVFAGGGVPNDTPTIAISSDKLNIVDLVLTCKLAPSKNEARRLVQQNAVSIDGTVISSDKDIVNIKNGAVLKVGKRKFARLKLS